MLRLHDVHVDGDGRNQVFLLLIGIFVGTGDVEVEVEEWHDASG